MVALPLPDLPLIAASTGKREPSPFAEVSKVEFPPRLEPDDEEEERHHAAIDRLAQRERDARIG